MCNLQESTSILLIHTIEHLVLELGFLSWRAIAQLQSILLYSLDLQVAECCTLKRFLVLTSELSG